MSDLWAMLNTWYRAVRVFEDVDTHIAYYLKMDPIALTVNLHLDIALRYRR